MLDDDLQKIVEDGIVIKDDCVFLNRMLTERDVATARNNQDQTGVEAFVNGFHTDDYLKGQHSREVHLGQALSFATAVGEKWLHSLLSKEGEQLRLVINITDYGAHITIFKVRVQQPYLADDLESYSEPLLEVTYSK